MNSTALVVLAPIFIIVLIVSFQALSSGFSFGAVCSLILSVCVSVLSVVGLIHYLGDFMNAILLPYAALAISISLVLVLSTLGRILRKPEEPNPDVERVASFRGRDLSREKRHSCSIQKRL